MWKSISRNKCIVHEERNGSITQLKSKLSMKRSPDKAFLPSFSKRSSTISRTGRFSGAFVVYSFLKEYL